MQTQLHPPNLFHTAAIRRCAQRSGCTRPTVHLPCCHGFARWRPGTYVLRPRRGRLLLHLHHHNGFSMHLGVCARPSNSAVEAVVETGLGSSSRLCFAVDDRRSDVAWPDQLGLDECVHCVRQCWRHGMVKPSTITQFFVLTNLLERVLQQDTPFQSPSACSKEERQSRQPASDCRRMWVGQ